ncbi:MAG: hypothetical protein HY319_29190 [Armatimonadetes bacterium]|nr:hypothetical protein [Armatimonadota bacterium]
MDFATGLKVDLIVRQERAFSREEFSRRAVGEVLGRRAFVASAEDIMLSKLEWYTSTLSDQQLRDASGVLDVQGDRLDFDYIERWARELGVADLWQKLKSS